MKKKKSFLSIFFLLVSGVVVADSSVLLGGVDGIFEPTDVSGQLCPEELDYIEKRLPSIKSSLCSFLGEKELNHYPSISICFSGGGYRAMLGSLAFMETAEEIGLLGTAKYIASLSGSTWMLGHLLLRMQYEGVTIKKFKEIVLKRLERKFLKFTTFDLAVITIELLRVLKDRGRIEPADVWGMILWNRLFGDIRRSARMSFSEIRTLLTTSSAMPFPLFSTILSDLYPYEWLEVNPFTTGSDFLGGYIPTKEFDSVFNNGVCQKLYPEKSLGWFFAMFGSAYNISFGDIFILLAKSSGSSLLISKMEKMVEEYQLQEKRFLTSWINNFVYAIPSVPLTDRKHIEISDAGIDFNIPIPLVTRASRSSDIIIVLDSSSDADPKLYHELRYAAEYAKRKGIKFPSMDAPKNITENVLLFEDTDKTVPIVLYFAIRSKTSTFDFDYTKAEIDEIFKNIKTMIVESQVGVKDVLKRKCFA